MKEYKWISVKERLPEKSGRYLVCTNTGCVINTPYDVYSKDFFVTTENNSRVIWWSEIPDIMKDNGKTEIKKPNGFDFEKFSMLTCIQPDEVLLDAIEKIYEQEYENYGSFEDFCEDFRCNKNGLFSKAQVLANGRLAQLEWKIASVSEMIDGLRKKVSELENGMCEKIAEFDDALRSTIEYVESINDFRR